ncbi:MAG: hypothetical protein WAN93_01675 [Solirubrobacteraceae bacterium]
MAGADEAGETRSQAPEQTPQEPEQTTDSAAEQAPQAPGFGERGRMRRRARFLRKARELAYRDLGGLVFDLHRFGQRNDQLVLAKLASLRHVDIELRELEEVLGERRPVTVLREVGIAACPRCAAIHDSDDRFCPRCGLAFDTNADRPISTSPVAPQAQIPVSQTSAPPAQISAAAMPSPSTSPPAQPRIEPAPSVKPKVEPSPPVKPTAPPDAAKPASLPAPSERGEPDGAEQDEPTQILRPPVTGT